MSSHALSPYQSRFFGRSHELEALHRAVDTDRRLITLCGPPGAGKTRLAREFLARLQERAQSQPDQNHLLASADLSVCTSTDGILSELASALDISFAAGLNITQRLEQLSAALANSPHPIVLLDNAETVLGPLTDLLARWLPDSAPSLTILVTSRHPLQLDLEVLMHLGALSLPEGDVPTLEQIASSDAIALFLDRAQKVRPHLQLSEDNATLLSSLVQLLDGLPLGIELAASRLGMLNTEDLLHRLQKTFDVLSNLGSAESRHPSLHAAIELSWNLLDPFDASLLETCSLFRGGFDLPAVEAVAAPAADASQILEALHRLRDHHLLFIDYPNPDTPRQRLYESIREFAARRRNVDPTHRAAQARHVAYFGALSAQTLPRVERLYDPKLNTRLRLELDNFNAALDTALETRDPKLIEQAIDCALALVYLLRSQGNHNLAIPRLRALADAAAEAGLADTTRRRLHIAEARLLLETNHYDEALERLDDEIQAAQNSQDRNGLVHLGLLASQSCYYSERIEKGWDYLKLAESLPEPIRRPLESELVLQRGRLHHLVGQRSQALRAIEASLKLARDHGDFYIESLALHNLAVIFGDTDFEQSVAYALEAADRHRRCGNFLLEAQALNSLGVVYMHYGNSAEARQCFEKARRFFRQAGLRVPIAMTSANLSMIALEDEDIELARSYVLDALAICRGDDDLYVKKSCQLCLAYTFWFEERFDEALLHLDNALEDDADLLHFQLRICLITARGALLAITGNIEAARNAFSEAEAILREVDEPVLDDLLTLHRQHLRLHDYRVAHALGDSSTARRAFLDVLNILGELGADGPERLEQSEPLRYALRLLEPALPPIALAIWHADRQDASRRSLLVYNDEAFRAPAGPWNDLSRSPTLQRLFAALLRARTSQPGTPLHVEELQAQTWPDERLLDDAALNRLNVNLSKLRGFGLRPLLQRLDDGYLFDPAVEIVIIND